MRIIYFVRTLQTIIPCNLLLLYTVALLDWILLFETTKIIISKLHKHILYVHRRHSYTFNLSTFK